MTGSPVKRPRRKRAGQYHHGDLRRALIDQALRTIDAHVVNLRKKLRRFEPTSVSTPVIATVWGLGYKLKIAVRNKPNSIPTIRTSKR